MRAALIHQALWPEVPIRAKMRVVLGELVQTTAGKWITHPPTRCPKVM